MILAIDPGSKVLGWAVLSDPKLGVEPEHFELKACGLLRPTSLMNAVHLANDLGDDLRKRSWGERVFAPSIYIEEPQSYIARLQKGDQNDLIHIALVGGLVAGAIDAVDIRVVKPREWKGQVDPDVMLKRIMKRLNPAETVLVEAVKPPSLLHNCQDAVGLALWAAGRLGFR